MIREFTARVKAMVGVAMLVGLALMPPLSVAQSLAGVNAAKPITLVVPYPAGAAVDSIGRLIASRLHTALNQPVVVENRAGAGSQIGTAYVARANPDGHTLLVTTIDALTLLPLVRDVTYDPSSDLVELGRVASIPYSIQAHPSTGIHSLDQLIARAKQHPGTLRYGSTGNGSLAHVAMELLANKAGIELLHVPYKGMAASVNDLLAGHIDLGVVSTSTISPHMAAGKVLPVSLMTDDPNPLWPGLQGTKQSGITGVNAELEFVVVAPAGTPSSVVEPLSTTLTTMSHDPAFAASLNKLEMIAAPLDAAQTVARRQQEAEKWKQVLPALKIDKE